MNCPLCNYNLTGLERPQCPECGHAFNWTDLTDPTQQKIPWLFEHHPSLRTYLATHFHLFHPYRFWKTLRPSHLIFPARLRLFLFLNLLLNFTFMVAATLSVGMAFNYRFILKGSRPFWTFFSLLVEACRDFSFRPLIWSLVPPTTTLILLLLMRPSFARTRLKRIHILRIVTYAANPLVFTLPLICFLFFVAFDTWMWSFHSWLIALTLPLLVLCLCIALWLLHLEAALRIYLRLPHPWLITLAALAIAGLSSMLIFL